MSKVAVLKTSPSTVVGDYGRLMDMAGYQRALPKGRETIIKLNLSWSLYFPACSTEPWQLDGVLAKMTADGYRGIIPVENRTVVTDPWKGAKLNKWLPVLDRYHLKFTPLTEVKWTPYKPKAEMLAMDRIFPDGFSIPEMFPGKNVLHLPTQKTHGHTTITGAMKNAFGGLLTKRRHHSHRMIHEVLVDLLAIQKEIHTGIFAVTDGTVCGDGAGPRAMVPKVENYILASEDQVAIDAVSAKMMGFDPMKIPFIKIAHDRGLGVGDVGQIDIVGEDISRVDYRFKTEKSLVVWGDQLFRKGALSFLERLVFHTPIFKLCILGSAVFHDNVWYPTTGKKRIDEFMKTEWGALLQKY
ncbi:MAG: DUF362 domain-containing protein [Candidatus Altiarchaeota archaeon]|nr:DUF362 domain-containing protein [Candidatus Altiarchaeota archaeon]